MGDNPEVGGFPMPSCPTAQAGIQSEGLLPTPTCGDRAEQQPSCTREGEDGKFPWIPRVRQPRLGDSRTGTSRGRLPHVCRCLAVGWEHQLGDCSPLPPAAAAKPRSCLASWERESRRKRLPSASRKLGSIPPPLPPLPHSKMLSCLSSVTARGQGQLRTVSCLTVGCPESWGLWGR